MKTCSGCRDAKPGTEFYKNQNYCKDCSKAKAAEWKANNRARWNATNRAFHERNPEKRREYRLRREYGLTPGAYEDMLAGQGQGCAICGLVPLGKPLAVDHDHETGAIRGLLCDNCNHGLGKFMDSPRLLTSAIAYLRLPKGVSRGTHP